MVRYVSMAPNLEDVMTGDDRRALTQLEMGELAYYAIFGHWDRMKNQRVPGLLELRDRDFLWIKSASMGIGVLVLSSFGVPISKLWPALSGMFGIK